MPGVFKEWISSGVTEREHANATISSIGALSQCERPVGSFLVDLRGETRFAGVAGAAGSGGGGVTLTAGTGMPGAGLHWAVEGGSATLAARIGLRAAGNADAAEGAGGTLVHYHRITCSRVSRGRGTRHWRHRDGGHHQVACCKVSWGCGRRQRDLGGAHVWPARYEASACP